MESNIIPVALFTYARPDHLKQTLDGLRINKVPLVYAFSDGPKDDTKTEKVREVRRVLKEITWTEIIITEREANWGLGTSIRAGVTEVLNKHDKIIVIEDDIVMRPGAYLYTCAALNYFKNDTRIMTVSMWTHPIITPKASSSGFFSERFVCWGWGTYKWAWELYDGTPKKIYNQCIKQRIKPEKWGKDILWQVENSEVRDLWYVGFALTHFLYNKISFFPGEPLSINIGRDATAENTTGGKQDDYSLKLKSVNNFRNGISFKYSKGLENRFVNYFDYRKKSIKYLIWHVYKKIF